MSNIRFQALRAVLTRTIPEVKAPSSKISEFYSINVFDKRKDIDDYRHYGKYEEAPNERR